MNKYSAWLIGMAAGLLACVPAWACSIPVFRYALERWAAEPYQVVVFHHGALAGDDAGAMDALVKSAGKVNIDVVDADLDDDKLDDALKALWKTQKASAKCWVVVRLGGGSDDMPPLWVGKLDGQLAAFLAESPVRKEMAGRLMRGESAVWILLESGDKKQDDAAAALLTKQLAELQKSMAVTAPDPDAPGPQLRSSLPLKIGFSLLRVSKTDAKEKLLAAMLLAGEDAKETAVFAVIGRGRALPPLVGKDIDADKIAQIAAFVCGDCSCEVKEMNPGHDLLISADWDSVLDGGVADVPTTQPAEPRLVPIPTGIVPQPNPTNQHRPATSGHSLGEDRPLSHTALATAILLTLAILTGTTYFAARTRG